MQAKPGVCGVLQRLGGRLLVLMKFATRCGCRTIESETAAAVQWERTAACNTQVGLAKRVCSEAQGQPKAPVSFLMKSPMPYATGFKLVSSAIGNRQ